MVLDVGDEERKEIKYRFKLLLYAMYQLPIGIMLSNRPFQNSWNAMVSKHFFRTYLQDSADLGWSQLGLPIHL